jgi:hypothetical protein
VRSFFTPLQSEARPARVGFHVDVVCFLHLQRIAGEVGGLESPYRAAKQQAVNAGVKVHQQAGVKMHQSEPDYAVLV